MKNRYIIPLLIVATLLLLLKVYIANELYYTSRNIQKLSIQINALKEERNILKLQIEKLKYKNTIIDPLFNYQPKEIPQTNQEPIQEEQTKPIQNTQNTNQKAQQKSTKELFETITIDDDNGDTF